MKKLVMLLVLSSLFVSLPAFASDFVCQSDVPTHQWSPQEQKYVDAFWKETLVYLRQFERALETPTGKCLNSAQAVFQSYDSELGHEQTGCIMRKRDVELMVKHIKAVLAEPDKAKKCFDPQLTNYNGWATLYTPSEAVRDLSPVAQWLHRPLATTFFKKKVKNPVIRAAGLDLNRNFIKIASKTTWHPHFTKDITIKGLPTLWSSVGWIPFYAQNPKAVNKRLRGGYLYAEVMGPWGNLRISKIDGESVGAEVGMTAQLNNTSYPTHFHNPQEIYMTLTKPDLPKQNQTMAMYDDSDQFKATRTDHGFKVDVNGKGKWQKWYIPSDPVKNWLLYLDRNELHAFYAADPGNRKLKDTGWVSVWARTTARDNDQNTHLSTPQDPSVKRILPWTPISADTHYWKP